VLECKVVLVSDLGLHQHFVGEILDVKVDDDCLDAEGKLLLERIAPVTYAPGESAYYEIGERLAKAFAHGSRFESKA
jgi:flavin reductase (DIM6/NTAB) family NADH-FMN oxidoreductase RutF